MNWWDRLPLEIREPPRPQFVIGSDEVGTGALAGPFVVTAVVYPFTWRGLPGLQDSKKFKKPKEKQFRRDLAEEVYKTALTFNQQYVTVEEIDRKGMYPMLLRAHHRAIQACLSLFPKALVIVDGNFSFHRNGGVKYHSIVQADGRVPAVSAASVLGKVERDWWMGSYAAGVYPVYGFANHLGYGSPEHFRALEQYGPCEIHRKSYGPIKRLMRKLEHVG